MENESVEKVAKKHKKKKSSKVISFDEEVVPKHVAQQILAKENVHGEDGAVHVEEVGNTKSKKKKKKRKMMNEESEMNQENSFENVNNESVDMSGEVKRKNKKKRKADSNETEESLSIDQKYENSNKSTSANDTNIKKTKKKKKKVDENGENLQQSSETNEETKSKKKQKVQNPNESESVNDAEEGNVNESSEAKKEISIRQRKREKYAQLLKDKKLKTELALQQKALNYLSKWKHSRSEWKFEKLRQIWLQQNMYDSSKVPQEFWTTLVEYLSPSKGKSRDIILKEAVKIIEAENPEEDEMQLKIERARDIIQNLQE